MTKTGLWIKSIELGRTNHAVDRSGTLSASIGAQRTTNSFVPKLRYHYWQQFWSTVLLATLFPFAALLSPLIHLTDVHSVLLCDLRYWRSARPRLSNDPLLLLRAPSSRCMLDHAHSARLALSIIRY